MTIEDLLVKFGNWMILIIATAIGYVVWKEKTVAKVTELAGDIKHLEAKIVDLEGKLDTRSKQDIAIITALAEIKAQLQGVISSVAEVKAELRYKQDKIGS